MIRVEAAFLALAAVLIAGKPAAAQVEAEAFSVAASIKPVHALAAAVMEGVSSPHLIVRGGGSPHSYALRPSDAKALQEAGLVVWIGPEMETFLTTALASVAKRAAIVTLADTQGITRLALRQGSSFELSNGDAHGDEHHGGANHGGPGFDPHLWLDPQNAVAMARQIARALVKADPQNAAQYQANAQAFDRKIANLTSEIEAILAPVKDRPYITFHDAYQYFENRFGLNAAGSITLSPETSPGARRIRELRSAIGKLESTCIFAEPQFEPRLIEVVSEGMNVRYGMLDPLGSEFEPGPDLYIAMMRGLARALADCLTPTNRAG